MCNGLLDSESLLLVNHRQMQGVGMSDKIFSGKELFETILDYLPQHIERVSAKEYLIPRVRYPEGESDAMSANGFQF